MVPGSAEANGHVVDIGKNGFFGAFAVDERGWEGDSFYNAEGGIVFAGDTEYLV